MPEIRHYRVTQVREIDVDANNAMEAGLIAESAFDWGQNSDYSVRNSPKGISGKPTSKVREVNLHTDEKRN